MNEEKTSTLDVADLDNMLRAVKVSHTRGTYTMEEVAQLWPVVQRVEKWLEAYKSQLEAANTMPMPEAPAEEPVAEEPKKKQVKTKKQKK